MAKIDLLSVESIKEGVRFLILWKMSDNRPKIACNPSQKYPGSTKPIYSIYSLTTDRRRTKFQREV